MMKSKLKKMVLSFSIMIIFNLIFSQSIFWKFGINSPHVGLLYVLGLLLGPYGSLGTVLANVVIDFANGFTILEIIPSAILSFGVSYLAYKLWYSGFKTDKITKPVLDNVYHLNLFLSSIVICGLIYSAVHGSMIGLFVDVNIDEYRFVSYFLNFLNFAFIFGILSIWLSKKIDFIDTPKTSKKQVNKKLYRTLFNLLIISTILTSISLILRLEAHIIIGELILIGILLFGYLTKPFVYEVQSTNENSVVENIIRNFLIITLTIAIIGVVISVISYNYLSSVASSFLYLYLMPVFIITDVIIILFFIPGIFILKYTENKVLKPISSFSSIEGFIKENEKIESDGLVKIYSDYVNEQNEIGTLARSYTELINHNNNYIENLREIEGEKERIGAELDIAKKIQIAALPTEGIENDYFIVDGYSQPAKEVGGDFFDYYMIDDDNLAIVIGDASGKGVPAALVAMITQVLIKQMLKDNIDPSKVLYMLNNQLCENNPESMFLTVWLGIYNKNTNKLTFSNAGHNRPLIKENDKYEFLNIDTGIVLGVIEDFDYVLDEISLNNELILYTDGITDANNEDDKMYGEDRLLMFFNDLKNDSNPINPLLNDIDKFTKDAEQYDDMTLLYLQIK